MLAHFWAVPWASWRVRIPYFLEPACVRIGRDFSSAKEGKGQYSDDTMLAKAVENATGKQRLSAGNKDFLEQGMRRLAELAASSAWRAGPKVGRRVEQQLLKWAKKVKAAAAKED